MKKIFRPGHSTDDGNDGGKEEDEGGARSARFADQDTGAGPGKKKGGKKEVRVQEPASEAGEQPQKAKTTSAKKSAEKKGPPSVSESSY